MSHNTRHIISLSMQLLHSPLGNPLLHRQKALHKINRRLPIPQRNTKATNPRQGPAQAPLAGEPRTRIRHQQDKQPNPRHLLPLPQRDVAHGV